MKNIPYAESLAQVNYAVKPAAIYCRVSTDNQENEGTSLDTQRTACLKYCQDNQVPLPNQYYIRRLKENFSFIFFNGELRKTTCVETGKEIETNLPKELDTRILCTKAYLDKVK